MDELHLAPSHPLRRNRAIRAHPRNRRPRTGCASCSSCQKLDAWSPRSGGHRRACSCPSMTPAARPRRNRRLPCPLKRIVLKKRFGAELYDKAAPELHAGILAWHTTLHTNNHDHRRHHHRPETTHTPHTPHIIPSTTHHRSLHRSVASQELSRHRVVAIIRQDGACRYTYLG